MREGEKMYTPHQRQLLLFSSIRGRCVGVLLLTRDKPHVFRASNVTGVISGDDIRVRRSVIEAQPDALILSNPLSSPIWGHTNIQPYPIWLVPETVESVSTKLYVAMRTFLFVLLMFSLLTGLGTP